MISERPRRSGSEAAGSGSWLECLDRFARGAVIRASWVLQGGN